MRPPEVLAWSSPQFLPPGCSRGSSASIRQSNRTFHSPRFPWPQQSRCSVVKRTSSSQDLISLQNTYSDKPLIVTNKRNKKRKITPDSTSVTNQDCVAALRLVKPYASLNKQINLNMQIQKCVCSNKTGCPVKFECHVNSESFFSISLFHAESETYLQNSYGSETRV